MVQKRFYGYLPLKSAYHAEERSSGQKRIGGGKPIILLALVSLTLGCGATSSSFIPSGEYVTRPPNSKVLVYFEGAPPSQSYNVVGMVYAEKEANTATRWDIVEPEAVIELLKEKAGEIGAEAIIDVRVTTQTDRSRDYKKGEAKAVVFKKD